MKGCHYSFLIKKNKQEPIGSRQFPRIKQDTDELIFKASDNEENPDSPMLLSTKRGRIEKKKEINGLPCFQESIPKGMN